MVSRGRNSFLTFLSYENPRRKKYEIATDEIGNPIKQDEKKGVLREFKKGDIFFNYGCLPVSPSCTWYIMFHLCKANQLNLISLALITIAHLGRPNSHPP